MSKKSIAFLMALIMVVSVFAPQLSVNAAGTSINVQFNNGNTPTSSNTIYAKFKVENLGSTAINLADLKLRYYYTADADKPQSFWCDYAGMMNGSNYVGVTDKVTGTFVKMSSAVASADTYFEVGFISGAGSLPAGGSIEIQTRVARNDWTNYDQSNDYSYKASGTYVDWNQVSAYYCGQLVFGLGSVDPPIQAPLISQTTFSYSQGQVANDLTVLLTPNGNIFRGISGLTQGTDYTVSGNIVTILKSYLNRLTTGTKVLTFDFSVPNNPTLTLVSYINKYFKMSIGTAEGKVGDTVTVPITFKDVDNINGVGLCDLNIGYDSSLLEAIAVTAGAIVPNQEVNFLSRIKSTSGEISLLYLDNTIGKELINTDGIFATLTFKLKNVTKDTITPIVFKSGDIIGDGNFTKLPWVNKSNGSVTIRAIIPTISSIMNIITLGNAVDLPITISPNGNTFRGITGLVPGTDYTVSGNTVTILKSYLNTLTSGTKTLTFDFGIVSNPVFTFNVNIYNRVFKVSIGTATVKVGDTVTVSISFENVDVVNNVGTCSFSISYDTSLLEVTTVTAGAIVPNSEDNFASNINTTGGAIGFIFLDNTIGSESIKTDGVFANITFKLKSTTTGIITPIAFKTGDAFYDEYFNKIAAVIKTIGSITIN